MMRNSRKHTKTIMAALDCYRTNFDPQNCKKTSCPYNNNDEECGYYCCSNSILFDAARRLRYQEDVIKRLQRKIDSVWVGKDRR